MDKTLINKIKQKLLQQKQELAEDVNKTVEGLHQFQSKDEMTDFTDQSSVESNRDLLLQMNDRDLNILEEIERTLEKIEDGSYGICEDCGCEIGKQRLNAHLIVSLCVDCKTEQEKRNRFNNL
jgi:DnaK suppressor protein